jgi:hypothetical protein
MDPILCTLLYTHSHPEQRKRRLGREIEHLVRDFLYKGGMIHRHHRGRQKHKRLESVDVGV